MSRFLPTLVLGLATTTLATAAGPMSYQMIELSVGQGKAVRLPSPASTVTVAKPDVADVQVPAPTTMFVFGKAPGRSTVAAFGRDGHVVSSVDVRVSADAGAVKARLPELPGSRADADGVGNVIHLSGDVATPIQANEAIALAQAAAGKPEFVSGDLRVTQSTQVNLRVRIAEVSRTVSKELGFNWESLIGIGGSQILVAVGRDLVSSAVTDGTFQRSPTGADSFGIQHVGNNTNFNAVVDALAQDGLITVLAEPNLVARSGETASFLSGGEFPIPVAQTSTTSSAISVEFKQFGISLDFTPTVLDNGRISLHVRPEVSELDPDAGIQINGLRIPGLRVRRADTTVELGSGQSFAIAGLVQANSTNNVQKVPGLGNLPILGALFRSTRFQRKETELVIMVTPYLVRPVSSPTMIAVPTDTITPAKDFKSLLLGRLGDATDNRPLRSPLDLPGGPLSPATPVSPGGPGAPVSPPTPAAAAGAPPSNPGDAARATAEARTPAAAGNQPPVKPTAAARLPADAAKPSVAIQDIGFLLE